MATTTPIPTDPTPYLPLHLLPTTAIPPSPNTSPLTGSTIIDWLPDFAGYSWVAYGASSLLVISQFPSPLSHTQSHLGPLFRQVLPLSSSSASADPSVDDVVSSVSWSPAGDLAASIGRRIFVFQYLCSPGSFCWSQTALLVQCAKVEAIAWTSCGDGIVAAGTEVVLWKRNSKSWEIAWKFGMKVPQSLVSTTWSIEGPSATIEYPSELCAKETASMATTNCVNVFYHDGKSVYVATDLRHPQPVFAIQWRPSGGSLANRAALYAPRHVLLTSCLDGSVRLWSEIDGSRIRKGNKENRDPSTSKRHFCVVAVIELNQSSNGLLGPDVFLTWALDIEGAVCVGEKQLFSAERLQNNEVGRCEWLVGFGPGKLLTYWAVHCLDDFATVQSPRVTLWKRQELLESGLSYSFGGTSQSEAIQYKKAVIWRDQRYGPPAICSLLCVSSASHKVDWSVLYNQSLLKTEEKSLNTCEATNRLSVHSGGILNTLSHSSKLLQVTVHPFMCEGQLAASLDSNGLIIFWSIPSGPDSILGLGSFTPSWQLVGKIILQNSFSKDICLCWAPLSLGDDRILLVAHNKGIDLHIVRTFKQEFACHKICTIPFVGDDDVDGPDKFYSFSLDPTCKDSLDLLLMGIWMKEFQAKSWKVVLHCYESSASCCEFKCDTKSDENCTWAYKTDFSSKTYCIIASLCSSYFPDGHDEITSVSVVCPSLSPHSLQKSFGVEGHAFPNNCPYHLVTGHSDGATRLWKIEVSEVSKFNTPFELVGMFSSYLGSIKHVSIADWGLKVATISSSGQANILCIWEPLHLAGVGTFELEDKIYLNGEVLALHWLVIENMLFLGVCFQNELLIYSRKIHNFQTLASEAAIWVCIAIVCDCSAIRDFLLGPNGTIVVLHDKYFTLYSQWSFLKSTKILSQGHVTPDSASFKNELEDNPTDCTGTTYLCEEEKYYETTTGSMLCPPLTKTSCSVFKNGPLPSSISQSMGSYLKMTEVTEKLCGPLPFFHPEILLMNIYSGNWRRAYVAIYNLIECPSTSTSEQRLVPAKSNVPIRQINLSNYFEGKLSNDRASQVFQWSNDVNTTWSSNRESEVIQFAAHDGANMSTASTTSSKSSVFHEQLEKLHLHEAYSESQMAQIFAIVDLLLEINNPQSTSPYENLDEPGRRFWCSIRVQQLAFRRKCSREPSLDDLVVDSQLMGWAFHSDCHTDLFDTILPAEPTWQEMRKIGVGFWFANHTELRSKMEKLARRQYLKNKDPKACALLYIALNRLQVLAGLFKISKDEKDKPLVVFLSRNFQEEKNKAAALKNAYVLMGKHQFELAIAFFLLGGDIASAINVCAKTLGDGQLAVVISRLAEGPGGPSERHLISKILLQSATEKGDIWLASVLEWMLGNHLQSFLSVLGFQGCSNVSDLERPKHATFLDPSIGQYCQVLAAKNSLRNAIGEQNTAILTRWAMVMTASAFNKCGFPLEALECLSSSAGILGALENGTVGGSSDLLPKILRPSPADSNRWLSNDVASYLVYQVKLDLAMQYITNLIKEHPYWLQASFVSTESGACSVEHDMSQVRDLFEHFDQKLDSALAFLEQKFSLSRNVLLNKIFLSLDNSKLLLIGYTLPLGSADRVHLTIRSQGSTQLLKHLIHASENLLYSLLRFVIGVSTACSHLLDASVLSLSDKNPYGNFHYLEFYTRGFISSIGDIKYALMMFYDDSNKDLIQQFSLTLDLCKYCIYLTSSMLQHNGQSLLAIFEPVLALYVEGAYRELDIVSLHSILHQVAETFTPTPSLANNRKVLTQDSSQGIGDNQIVMIPEDEKWMILVAFLWKHLSKFITCQLNQLHNYSAFKPVADSAQASRISVEADGSAFLKHVRQLLVLCSDTLGKTVAHISFHTALQLGVFLWHKRDSGTSVPSLMWLWDLDQSNSKAPAENLSGSSLYCTKLLMKICDDPRVISEVLAQFPIKLSEIIHYNPVRGWNHLHLGTLEDHERLESYKQEGIFYGSPRGREDKSPSATSEKSHNLLGSDKGTAVTIEAMPFHSPREIFRRNGELLEALCFNSTEQQQAAVASNKKGIFFFEMGGGLPLRDSSDYIWAQADWPQRGWAGTESTPVPTRVSPGVGLGSNRKGVHLGLGGATVGEVSQARLGKDLTVGGAFGVPGFAGIGATGMGWGVQDDFDKFIDPPATLDNISARALASHPSMPYFLVGSSNTHIYLWEFGEEKAVATYGVLAAANVPPPYALASITALQFDCRGQRFANSASDGTVCTWQLEVGGRSNVRPTESSICFNGHASDICYVATSGSIIAAAGYSSNGVNVVIWDTLAPPTSSRASVMCHEGGAHSISVFDNHVGTGSISPLIVTGGKGGDVGLHDFRYIATGKTKRHRQSSSLERVTDTAGIDVRSELSSSVGDQNRHGMLWYIPKAHSGSITSISTIPNTSFFLTGSKDGDVKLWDARKASLVYHWPKLHERHTFLQRSSQSFGGVTRAGVTDIQVISDGFLTCGGDGSVKFVELSNILL